MWNGSDFMGAKIAVLSSGGVLALQRDDLPGLPYAGLWDLPGGGREGAESPLDCALRELEEELGLAMPADRVVHAREWPAMQDPSQRGWFFAARWIVDLNAVRFGDEGQGWAWMPVSTFLSREDVVPELQYRLAFSMHHFD